jgi:hypothetical protein
VRSRLLPVVVPALLLGAALPAWAWEDYEKGENAPIVTVPAAPPSPQRLPYFGLMGDVGVPDGLIGSLVARPWTWLRLSGGGGSNGISKGWRTGITFLPFTAGPSASFEYGHYQDGNANSLAKKVIGGSFDGSPLLERVGYDYLNAHLGLDFGSRRVVFFLHGGVTFLRGQIHNVEAAIRNATSQGADGSGTTEVVVPKEPTVKAVGSSVKLGLIVYIW